MLKVEAILRLQLISFLYSCLAYIKNTENNIKKTHIAARIPKAYGITIHKVAKHIATISERLNFSSPSFCLLSYISYMLHIHQVASYKMFISNVFEFWSLFRTNIHYFRTTCSKLAPGWWVRW